MNLTRNPKKPTLSWHRIFWDAMMLMNSTAISCWLCVAYIPALYQKKKKALNKQGLIKKNTGRHDWTRTNDPHHVKVVL